MTGNWCLTASDSAATAPRPPGLASFCQSHEQMGDQDEQFAHENEL
jgi:hypothetical protein